MPTVIIPIAIIAVIVFVVGFVDDLRNYSGMGDAVCAGIFPAFFSVLLSGFLSLVLSIFTPAIAVSQWSAEIQNIRDGQSVQGMMFLGSGSIKDEPQFFYYTKNGNSFQLHYAAAAYTTIVEDDSTPRIEGFDQGCGGWLGKWVICGRSGEESYVIHIPPGSVIRNFTLGSQPMSN